MDRRLFITGAVTSALVITTMRGVIAATDSSPVKGDFPLINKTREEWLKLLDAQQYEVLFEDATERPWSSSLNDEKREGTYICSACYLPMFLSETKFDSGTGWPSFYQAIEGNAETKGTGSYYFPALNTIARAVAAIRDIFSMMAPNLPEIAGVTTA